MQLAVNKRPTVKKIQNGQLDFFKTVMQESSVKDGRASIASREESGQGLVEYGLILGLISILVVTIFVTFEGVVDIGGDSSGTLSDQGIGRAQGSLSSGIY